MPPLYDARKALWRGEEIDNRNLLRRYTCATVLRFGKITRCHSLSFSLPSFSLSLSLGKRARCWNPVKCIRLPSSCRECTLILVERVRREATVTHKSRFTPVASLIERAISSSFRTFRLENGNYCYLHLSNVCDSNDCLKITRVLFELNIARVFCRLAENCRLFDKFAKWSRLIINCGRSKFEVM